MRVGIVGRADALYKSMELLSLHHEIAFIITAKEAPEYKYGMKEFEAYAKKHSIPFLVCNKLESDEVRALLDQAGNVDIVVSCNFTFVIRDSFIENFRIGVLNVHGGDIPRYRGNACQAWAIVNGEKQIGLCVYKMEGSKLDVGEVVVEDFFNMNPDTNIGEVMEWINSVSPNLFLKAINILDKDPGFKIRTATEMDPNGFRCFPRQPSDGLINWRSSAESIVRLINASSEPYSGAFTSFKNEKLIIWRAERVKVDYHYFAIPGQVMEISPQYVIVAAGDGVVKLTMISREGGEKVTPSLILNSIRNRLGE